MSLCSVVVIDLRGHGESQASQSGRYDLTTHISDVVRVLEHLGRRSLILVGHSLGGQIVVHLAAYALKAPVNAVILVDICADPNSEGSRQVWLNLKKSTRVYATIEDYRSWLVEARPLLSTATSVQLAMAALRRCANGYELKLDPLSLDPERRANCSSDARDWDHLLRSIACPTLLIRGEASAVVSAQSARRLVGGLPQGRLVTVEQAGHAVMSDNPQGFTDQTVSFVQMIMGSLGLSERCGG